MAQEGDVWAVTGVTLTAVISHGTDIYAGTDTGLVTVDADGTTPVAAAQGFAVRDLAVNGDVIWIASDAGLQRYDADGATLLAPLTAPEHLADDDVSRVRPDAHLQVDAPPVLHLGR